MKQIKIFLLSLASSFGAMAADIDVTPGQLESLLGDGVKSETELKLRGNIDARDLAALEKLPGAVEKLDLSEVSINPLSMPTRKYFGKTLFNAGEIPSYTFFKSNVRQLILPATTGAIGEGAFAGSEIEEITIPEGVAEIGDYAFYGCHNLKKVTLPASITSVGRGAFGNCTALESLDLSATKITELPEKAFAGAVALKDLKLPAGVAKVGREAFSHTAVSSLSLGGVKEFEAYALSGMPYLTELSINPDANIGDGLLMDDISLESLTGLPEFVPDYFAANCKALPSEKLVEATSLGRYSFANTQAPETLVLTGYLTEIKRGALSGLGSITVIDASALENNVPAVDETTFEGLVQEDIVLWVDDDSFDAWESHPVWRLFQVKSQNQTGVDKIEAVEDSGIRIAVSKGFLTVSSPAGVSDVRIYTADGRMAYVASPDRETVEIETASLPSGVVIVAATDREGNSRTLTVML